MDTCSIDTNHRSAIVSHSNTLLLVLRKLKMLRQLHWMLMLM
jgi:hypothetical protein